MTERPYRDDGAGASAPAPRAEAGPRSSRVGTETRASRGGTEPRVSRVGPETRAGLRRGWTTGTCAAAAAKAAFACLCGGAVPDPVAIVLPRGGRAVLPLAGHGRTPGGAWAAVTKDAGDDPDVTHGCLVRVDVTATAPGTGVRFAAGPGVGTVTRPGLPLAPGEPAINPVPRAMIAQALCEIAADPDVLVTVSIPGGEELARRTLNPRLGIVGGLSILGTTGVVVPFSCAAWVHSIHRGIDVARAAGIDHLAAATGSTSERAVQALYGLPETALIEMGDMVGATLKYLRRHPVARLTVAGGFAKLSKLAAGALDLHSRAGLADPADLARLAGSAGADPALQDRIAACGTALEALRIAREAGLPLADRVAAAARARCAEELRGRIEVEVIVVDRDGAIVGRAGAP